MNYKITKSNMLRLLFENGLTNIISSVFNALQMIPEINIHSQNH